jgi:hypothetical protein
MLLTKPDDSKVLNDFALKIKPGGFWKNFYRDNNASLKYNAINWIFTVAGAYSLLFAIGKLIFSEYLQASLLLFVSIISFAIVYFTLDKQTKHDFKAN